MQEKQVFHFYSSVGTPTDNPRVERSHLTDDVEFYKRGNIHKTFDEQERALQQWEHTYNYIRPHQGLGLSDADGVLQTLDARQESCIQDTGHISALSHPTTETAWISAKSKKTRTDRGTYEFYRCKINQKISPRRT